ncbi:MAG: gamma-glutamylcyclotransferase family protein [Pseudomonadota bacterium]
MNTPGAQHRLATYGTLAPGQANADQLDGLKGTWQTGTVRGKLIEEGWGADHGCPGLILGPEGQEVTVHLFTSTDLSEHWDRLDAFEGAEYRRTVTFVATEAGVVSAMIYEIVT